MDFREDEFDVFEKGDFMETIRNVEINQLHDFKNHPFKVEVNTELCELMKSIEKEGVIVPLLVRTNPYGDGYEIISGHRRKEAAVWAGETKVPVVVRELDDDQAVVAMVDSNLHRENLKPSEKAFAYKMKLDAMKHQGKRLPEVSSLDDGAEVLADNEAMAVIEERIRQAAREEARQEANKEVMSMVGSMLAAMQANKGEISIIQQQADTDDNADLDADFYDGVIAQSALNWMEKD